MSACPLCDQASTVEQSPDRIDNVDCECCGKFHVGTIAHSALEESRDPERYLLSGVTRDLHERGSPLLIHVADRQPRGKREGPSLALVSGEYGTVDIAASVSGLVPATVHAKARKLLRAIARKSALGATVNFRPEKDYPLSYVQDEEAFLFLLRHLEEVGYVKATVTSSSASCRLTGAGWAEVESHVDMPTDKAFVAMWFTQELKDTAYSKAFDPAIRESGYKPVRVDLVPHVDKIDDRIIAEIRECRFLVADFTGQRGGVYFEAGFAMGLGRPVIWTCRKDEIGKVHFDTRQYAHIVWETADDLREQLRAKILAVIGRGPVKSE